MKRKKRSRTDFYPVMIKGKKIEVKNVSKTYPNLEVLSSLSFSVREGEFVSILGPSGCGKSTLLKITAGLMLPDAGDVLIDGQLTTGQPGQMSFMHQNDLLMPWKQIIDNIALPLLLKKGKRKTARSKASKHLESFGLKGFENYYPNQLSGGMRQRAALLRTYLYRNDLMLLDEPFGALDAMTREKMQQWLLSMVNNWEATILMVTHDIDEAILLSHRILLLSSRPSTIIEGIDIPFDKTRSREILFSNDFLLIKQRIIDLLGI